MELPEGVEWMMDSPAERATPPAAVVAWCTAGLLHHFHASPLDVALPAVTCAGAAFGLVRNRTHAKQAAAAIAGAGGWLSLAAWAGPAAGPYDAVSLLWLAGSAAGWAAIVRHDSVRRSRQWRNAKLDWLDRAQRYGLTGSHLQDYQQTRLGEAWEVDVTGTGRRASAYAQGDLAERIAEIEMLPTLRVQVSPARLAGRVRISVRRSDPWKHSPPHPVLDSAPELELPVPCSIRDPLTVGMDPETGNPLTLTVWDQTGSKNVLIVGKKGSGKSTLLSCIRERLTAAGDALIFDINVSKAQENLEWAPACEVSAIGRDQKKRALVILKTMRRIIDYRAAQSRDTSNFQPTPAEPLVIGIIDEIDALTAGGDYLAQGIRSELGYLASKDRSEAVGLILAGQRGTAEWIGGANVRSQLDVVCLGKVSRRGEMHHAAGDMGLMLPDMSSYGEGHPGVWVIAEDGGAHQVGRTFQLTEPPDIRRIAAARAGSRPSLEPGLAEYLGETWAELRGRAAARAAAASPAGPGTPSDNPLRAFGQAVLNGDIKADPETTETLRQAEEIARRDDDSLGALDREAEDSLPDELKALLSRIDGKNRNTRGLLAEALAMDIPEADPAAVAAHTAARWDQGAEVTEIPAEAREDLLHLLAEAGAEGISGRKLADALGGKRWQVMTWLNRLRWEKAAHIAGKGRAARWVIGPGGQS